MKQLVKKNKQTQNRRKNIIGGANSVNQAQDHTYIIAPQTLFENFLDLSDGNLQSGTIHYEYSSVNEPYTIHIINEDDPLFQDFLKHIKPNNVNFIISYLKTPMLLANYISTYTSTNTTTDKKNVPFKNTTILHHPLEFASKLTQSNIMPDIKNVNKCINIIPVNESLTKKFKVKLNYYLANDTCICFESPFWLRLENNPRFESDLTQNWWWVNYSISNNPSCSNGKLMQTYGTCWFHSMLNMLFLTEHTKKLLQQQWKQFDENSKKMICGAKYPDACESLENACPLSGESKRISLMRIFYNVFIRGVKLHPFSSKLIERNAAESLNKVKGFTGNSTSLELFNQGANVTRILVALQDVIINLFHKVPYLWLDSSNKTLWNNDDKDSQNIELKVNGKYEFIVVDGTSVSFNETPYTITHKGEGNEFVEYHILVGCLIHVNIVGIGGHAIVGLKCDDEYYVYDSNNVLAVTNWHVGDIGEYIRIATDFYKNQVDIVGIFAYLYVPEASNKASNA